MENTEGENIQWKEIDFLQEAARKMEKEAITIVCVDYNSFC